MRQLHRKWGKSRDKSQSELTVKPPLIHWVGMLQVDQLPIASNDPVANRFGAPTLFGHLVRVERFSHACAAVCSVGRFKTGMQAGVPVPAITVTVAGLLVHDCWRFGYGFVRVDLDWLGETLVGKLLLCEHCRKRLSICGRCRMESGDIIGWLSPVGLSNSGGTQQQGNSKEGLHIALLYRIWSMASLTTSIHRIRTYNEGRC